MASPEISQEIFTKIVAQIARVWRSIPKPIRSWAAMESNMREDTEHREDASLIDLGAASEVTLGIFDPVQKETLGTPHARDF
jgi:hypothetical protein